ncbi:fasciclin domain-containing protein [Sphingomonas sp. HDW15A]|uniref:fasciclin domain-containing protein n=1 Tax=Sphingomonas sp. HDW15A TaxID=2714942 RepID=UPI001409113E|nr:fasciclin domain-containing protein [Sphingomonas sp. HDW15A]QIK95951.1 fasciclin domain-containing protein [Sphingomonas sp. HDW15A]
MPSHRLVYLTLAAASIPLVTTAALSHNHKAGAKSAGNIVAGVSASKDHKTLVAAVKAAGLVDTLASGGPFTVFAPTDAAFGKLPAGTLDTLLKPENKGTLTSILTYHVVSGKVSAKSLVEQINAGGGQAVLTTVQGGKLTATLDSGKVVLRDQSGGTATVTTADLMQSNGVIHVTDSVSLPG